VSIPRLWEITCDCLEHYCSISYGQAIELEKVSDIILSSPNINVANVNAVDKAIRQLRTAATILKKMMDSNQLAQDEFVSVYKTLQNIDTVANRLLFGSKLKNVRNAKGYNVTELASSVGVDRSYISKLEKAVAGPPDIEVIAQLSYVLAVPMSEFVVDAIGHISFERADNSNIVDPKNSIISDIARECEAIPEEYLVILLAQVKAISQTYRKRKFEGVWRRLDQ